MNKYYLSPPYLWGQNTSFILLHSKQIATTFWSVWLFSNCLWNFHLRKPFSLKICNQLKKLPTLYSLKQLRHAKNHTNFFVGTFIDACEKYAHSSRKDSNLDWYHKVSLYWGWDPGVRQINTDWYRELGMWKIDTDT